MSFSLSPHLLHLQFLVSNCRRRKSQCSTTCGSRTVEEAPGHSWAFQHKPHPTTASLCRTLKNYNAENFVAHSNTLWAPSHVSYAGNFSTAQQNFQSEFWGKQHKNVLRCKHVRAIIATLSWDLLKMKEEIKIYENKASQERRKMNVGANEKTEKFASRAYAASRELLIYVNQQKSFEHERSGPNFLRTAEEATLKF